MTPWSESLMNKSKLLGMLGLARKAGKISAGTEQVCLDMRSGKAKLVVVASDISEVTRKRILSKADFYHIRCYECDITMMELSDAIGKDFNAAAVSVKDVNFAQATENILTAKQ